MSRYFFKINNFLYMSNDKDSDVALIIPARIGSTRLKNKLLLEIGNVSLIEHVIRRAIDTAIPNIFVATDSAIIADIATNLGICAIMTSATCASGTDRIYEAFQTISKDNTGIKYIVNLQGDMPFVNPKTILTVIDNLKNSNFDITTPVVKIEEDVAMHHSNVKVVINQNNQALYFSRNMIPYGAKQFLYHVGIYGFTAKALKKFTSMPQTDYEIAEQLEQLRALENGMTIGVCHIHDIPISIDTEEDLIKARKYFAI